MISYCAQWLREYLQNKGRSNVKDIQIAAKKMGWIRKELKEAKGEIGVKTFHDQSHDNWFWYL